MKTYLLLACTVVALTASETARSAGLRDGFAGAVELNAELRGLEAQRPVTDARMARGGAILPGAPSVLGGARSGLGQEGTGYLQFEVGAQAPIWLPREARALRGLADAQGRSNEVRIARARLLLAGQVREAFWTWAIAIAAQEVQRTRLEQARAMEGDVGRGVSAGNIARADLLLATATVREAEAGLREAQRSVREAAIGFRVLTGLNPTAQPPETPAAGPVAAREDDPRLVAARAAVETGRAGERLAAVRDRDSPVLGAQIRTQRDTRSQPFDTNVLVYGRLPLRHGPTYREALAEARAATATSEAELASAERSLQAAVARAREARAAALDLARLAESRHAALAEQTRLYEASFRAGQLPFIEIVRVRTQLADADAARRRARAEAGRAASDINQVLGFEPR